MTSFPFPRFSLYCLIAVTVALGGYATTSSASTSSTPVAEATDSSASTSSAPVAEAADSSASTSSAPVAEAADGGTGTNPTVVADTADSNASLGEWNDFDGCTEAIFDLPCMD